MDFGAGVALGKPIIGGPGTGAFASATLDMIFTRRLYKGITEAGISITRASTGYAQTSAGVWVPYAANTLRLSDLGLLSEEVRTNSFLNSSAPATQSITLTTGFYTCWIEGSGSATISAGTATITNPGAATAGSPRTIQCTVGGTINVTIAGSVTFCQVENGFNATSRIDTAGASATRNTDGLVVSGGNFSSWFTGGAAGTFYIEAWLNNNTNSVNTARLFSINDGTTGNRLFVGQNPSNGIRMFADATAVNQVDSVVGTVSNAVAKIAIAYNTNDVQHCVNGVLGTADNLATIPTVTQLNIGYEISSFNLNGYIRRLAYVPSRLANGTLQSLTT